MPKKMHAGAALGAVGGVISMVLLALYFEADADYAAPMGACLLLASLFFAIAGGFTANGQWSWNMLTFMTFLAMGAVIALAIAEIIDLYSGAILAAIAALIVLALMFPSSKTWMERPRI
ncbi:MAG: hypothetical protein LBG62_05270 [Candidatus Methanoplasma sp.]|nr:hypothetical protein [Candidatus Methanoplasma sp.]